jgi:DNA-binding transcriptional MocR family regulator
MQIEVQRWSEALGASGRPAYLAIADAIADDIQAGRLPALAKLPSLRTLAGDMGLHYTTVARAYAEAQRRGLVDSSRGQGTFVRGVRPLAPTRSPGFVGLVEMTMNLPPEPQDDALMQRMRAAMVRLAGDDDLHELLRYQEFGGTETDRRAGATWLAPRLPGLRPDQLIVCPGIQSALLALFSTLTRPGDTVCCEALTYPGVKAIAAQFGVRLLGLAMDDEGLLPDAFEHACRTQAPKALYCNPTYLNPTTAVLSRARRIAIAQIARHHGIPIIEDDAYALLPSIAPPPLALHAPELVFYVSGMAKHVGAGLRVGYLVAPDGVQQKRLATTMRAMAIMASPLTTRLATRWIHDGTAQAALLAIRAESQARQKLVSSLLPRSACQTKPEAFHLWLRLPPQWTRRAFAARLREHGVGAVEADAFAATPEVPEAVRICLGGAVGRQHCAQSLEVIAHALAHPPST